MSSSRTRRELASLAPSLYNNNSIRTVRVFLTIYNYSKQSGILGNSWVTISCRQYERLASIKVGLAPTELVSAWNFQSQSNTRDPLEKEANNSTDIFRDITNNYTILHNWHGKVIVRIFSVRLLMPAFLLQLESRQLDNHGNLLCMMTIHSKSLLQQLN